MTNCKQSGITLYITGYNKRLILENSLIINGKNEII